MNIKVFNETEYIVNLGLESGQIIKIRPHSLATINVTKNDILIDIRRDIVSFKKKNKYILVLETKYKVTNIQNNETFRIIHEKIHAGANVYYDRLLMSTKTAICLMESNNILGAEGIKNRFNKSRRKYMFLIRPFENFPDLTILLILLGGIICCMTNWKIMIVYFLIMYFLMIVLIKWWKK